MHSCLHIKWSVAGDNMLKNARTRLSPHELDSMIDAKYQEYHNKSYRKQNGLVRSASWANLYKRYLVSEEPFASTINYDHVSPDVRVIDYFTLAPFAW